MKTFTYHETHRIGNATIYEPYCNIEKHYIVGFKNRYDSLVIFVENGKAFIHSCRRASGNYTAERYFKKYYADEEIKNILKQIEKLS